MRRLEGYRRGAGRGAARTGYAPGSYQTARISFEVHVCVKWMSMPCTALELPDSSEQKVRIVERDDPPLHVERVEHPSIAGYSLETFGPGQPLAARARWRRAFTPWMSANEFSQSEGATMWGRGGRMGSRRGRMAWGRILVPCTKSNAYLPTCPLEGVAREWLRSGVDGGG